MTRLEKALEVTLGLKVNEHYRIESGKYGEYFVTTVIVTDPDVCLADVEEIACIGAFGHVEVEQDEELEKRMGKLYMDEAKAIYERRKELKPGESITIYEDEDKMMTLTRSDVFTSEYSLRGRIKHLDPVTSYKPGCPIQSHRTDEFNIRCLANYLNYYYNHYKYQP